MKALAAVLGIVMLAGCATPAQVAMRDDDDDHMPLQRMARGGVSGGVFTADTVSLTSDSRAYRVGDAVTVILQETTQASKRAGTSISKGSSIGISPPPRWARSTTRRRSTSRPTAISRATPPAPSRMRCPAR